MAHNSKSPLGRALIELAAPWAKDHGFEMRSPYMLARNRPDVGAQEVVEFQWSNKHPYRMYTVNLGLFHPDFCEHPPATAGDVSTMHCARETRLGHLMTKSVWARVSRWYRFGSGWYFFELIPPYGDCWWRYGRTVEETRAPVGDTLHHLTLGGLAWFENLRRIPTLAQLFDPETWAWFEFPGALAAGFGMRRGKPHGSAP